MNKWLKAISDIRKSECSPPPKDWLTSEQIGKTVGLKSSACCQYISKLIKAGKAERKSFILETGKGNLRKCFFYRLK